VQEEQKICVFFRKEKKDMKRRGLTFTSTFRMGTPVARVKIAPSCHTLEVQGASARCAVLSPVPVLLTVAGSEQGLPTALDAANF